MRKIDLSTWHRRDHYQFFSSFEYPHFNLCADVDITEFLPFVKVQKVSFTAGIMYLIARTANAIPEFRQRVRDEGPVEHEIVHPSTTILSQNDLFTFCTVEFTPLFRDFTRRAMEEMEEVKTGPSLTEKIQDDSMLFMTSIPWVSFTGFMHPLKLNPADSVPRFAWGKYRQEGDRTVMPLSVQAHHALVDGLHVGNFFMQIQELFDRPEGMID
jgi:chloramphenicol O-acetyltransferase type A